MLKFALFAMKILISITYVLHLVVTLPTPSIQWCTQLFQENVRLPIVEEVSHEGWCSSFGLPKNLVEVTNVEGPRDDSWSVQLILTTSSQNVQIII